jgi:hypothetical protein
MQNIKITVEVDGKIVPLSTISTESFEAIKALEKPKDIPIPVARWATCGDSPRLIFKPSRSIQLKIGKVYALDLRNGNLAANWALENDDSWMKQYQRVTPQL